MWSPPPRGHYIEVCDLTEDAAANPRLAALAGAAEAVAAEAGAEAEAEEGAEKEEGEEGACCAN